MNDSDKKSEDEELLRNTLKKIKILTAQVKSYSEPIAIIGMGCRFPGGGNNPEEFWHVLESGIDGICEVPKDRFDVDAYYDPAFDVPGKMYTRHGGFLNVPVDLFDAEFFGISPKEAEAMDPQQRLLLEVTWEALENALVPPESLEGTSTGVYVGISYNDYGQIIFESKGLEGLGAYFGTGNTFSAAAGRISFALGLKGPCLSIDTACSSSLAAINSACESLHLGECQQAIAGGVALMLGPGPFIMACQAHMLAPDGHCKTFDKLGDGYARSEGCGVVILKRLSDAKRDGNKIYALIKSIGVNEGGATSGLTVPNGEAQEALIRGVYSKVGLKPDDIDYLEAHGTGTSLGDPIEVRAIGATYGQRDPNKPLLLGSSKSNIGHAEPAAGIAGLIKTVLSLNHQMLPANLNFKELNPHIKLNFPVKILSENTPWKKGDHIRRAGVSSFGFTGINAHAVIEEAPEIEEKHTEVEERPVHILTLSARSELALNALVKSYLNFLDTTELHLADICYSANTGRNHERFRVAVVAKDVNELKVKLSKGVFVKGAVSTPILFEFSHKSDWTKELNELAIAYVNGGIVDWTKFDAPYVRQKVELPAYPFQRKRYWVDALDNRKEVNIEKNFYQISWKEVLEITELKNDLSQRKFLVYTSKGNKLFENIKSNCTFINAGEVTLDEAKITSDISDVVYSSDFDPSCQSLLALTQAIVRSGLNPKLWIIVKNAQMIVGREASLEVSQCALLGFCKVIALEHPELRCVRIDFDDSFTSDNFRLELQRGDFEDEVAIREGKRYVPRINEFVPTLAKSLSISEKGSYLITGGLGGIGLLCADWLIENGTKNLFLMARSKQKEEVQKHLNKYREQGISVTVLQGDISKASDVDIIFEVICKQGSPLKGIIHAAGVADNDFISKQSWERFSKVLAPKVEGTQNLTSAIMSNKINLDFYILFSSISGTLGSVSTSSYTAANYYLDQYAYYGRSLGLPLTSIAWGPWAEVGMAASEEDREMRLGYQPIHPKTGLKALELAIQADCPALMVTPMNWPKYFRALQFISPIYSDIQTKSVNLAEIKKNELGFALNKAKAGDRHKIVSDYVQRVIRKVLGFTENDEIDTGKGFSEMGMDSLLALEMRNLLQIALEGQCILTSTLTFDYPNVEKITDHILTELGLVNVISTEIEAKTDKLLQQNEPIAVIGMSCRLPAGGTTPESFWKSLVSGEDGITDIPAERFDIDSFYDPEPGKPGKIVTRKGAYIKDVDLFDAVFFGISPVEAEMMDPQQRLLLEVTWEAIENAGIPPASLKESATAVFIGVSGNEYGGLIQAQTSSPSPFEAIGNALNALSGRISYCLGLQGPSMIIDSACSSSLVSVHLACKSLQIGDCNLAIAGGTNILLSPSSYLSLSSSQMLSPEGHCKTFDASADGYARGEGIGVILLKRLSDAMRDRDPILAVIKGSAVNQDGPSSGLTVPNGVAQVKLIRQALKQANLQPADVSYIEAHGTGTSLGDPIEVNAIGKAYGESREKAVPLLIGSVKSNIGHLESAAGISSLIKVVLALNHKEIPGNLHFHKLNPKIDLESIPAKIVTQLTPWNVKQGQKRIAGISSFGFTGTNAHIILEEAPQYELLESRREERPLHLLTLSAKSKEALDSLIKSYQDFLESTEEQLGDIVYTASTGRNHERFRLTLIAKDIAELRSKLSKGEYVQGKGDNHFKIAFNYGESGGLFIHEIKDNIIDIDIGPSTNWKDLLSILSDYYVAGAIVDWKGFESPFIRKKIALPTYPFHGQRYWAVAAKPVLEEQKVGKTELLAQLEGLNINQRLPIIKKYVRGVLEGLLGSSVMETCDENINFFEMGIDSLLAVELRNRIQAGLGKELGLEINVIFDHPSIVAMSEYIGTKILDNPVYKEVEKLEEKTESDLFVLTQAQKRMWFLHNYESNKANYNVDVWVELQGLFYTDSLIKAINAVVKRHEALRTTFVDKEGVLYQVIHPLLNIDLSECDLSEMDPESQKKKMEEFIEDQRQIPFDLEKGPLLRAFLIHLADDKHVFGIQLHHICTDGTSMNIFFEELTQYYHSFAKNLAIELPPLSFKYTDYARMEGKSLANKKQLAYWQKRLSDAPSLINLPTDYPRSQIEPFEAAKTPFRISKSLSESMERFCKEQHSTPFNFFLSIYALLLKIYSGDTEINIGVPFANRHSPEEQRLIGLFVNTLVMNCRIKTESSFVEYIKSMFEMISEAFANQQISFESIVDSLKIGRNLTYHPLFQVSFNYLPVSEKSMIIGDTRGIVINNSSGTPEFDLSFEVLKSEEGYDCVITYNSKIFKAETIERLKNHYIHLMEMMIRNPQTHLNEICVLNEIEKQKILIDWNNTAKDFPRDKTVHQFFEEQVLKTPDNIALIFGEQQLTYRQLNEKANQLAHYLRKRGVKADTLIAMVCERSLEMIVGIYAILKAGGAYVPMDPTNPQERLSYMMEDIKTSILLTQSSLKEKVPSTITTVINLDELDKFLVNESKDNPNIEVGPNNLAYLIYTSGSTGKPKGVMIEHHCLSNYLWGRKLIFKLTPMDRFILKASYTFDASVHEIFLPTSVGATLVILEPEMHKDINYLCEFIVKHGITNILLITSMLQAMLYEPKFSDCLSLRQVYCGGEALFSQCVDDFYNLLKAELINLYGPTEATIDVSTWFAVKNSTIIPIGKPSYNTQFYILDSSLQPVPIGVVGELYIGGEGLARGYLNLPEITAERFINNPFLSKEKREQNQNTKLYRTGDLCRYLEDGNVEYINRIDHQVKIRGFRIEIGEIESDLLEHPAIQETIVLAREDEPGNKRLVAYYVVKQNATVDSNSLHQYLKAKLPEYMIPSFFIQLDKMPLTPNDKLDRKALPVPEGGEIRQHYVAPQTSTEVGLAKIWQEILHLEQVGIHDNFFELGGHSLLVSQMVSRVKRNLNIVLSLQQVFKTPTIADLAAQLDSRVQYVHRCLVSLNHEGIAQPLFCVHPIGGNVFCYGHLARALDGVRTCFGLQSQGLLTDQAPHQTIPEMAATYIQEIKTVQPNGPYHLLAWSFGGTVIIEMAHQLRQEGEKIGSLILIDAYAPQCFNAKIKDAEKDRLEILGSFANDMARTAGKNIDIDLDGFKKSNTTPDVERYVFNILLEQGVITDEAYFTEFKRLYLVYVTNLLSLKNYHSPLIEEDILLINSSMRTAIDKYHGWDTITKGKIHVHTLEGDHYSLMQATNALKLKSLAKL